MYPNMGDDTHFAARTVGRNPIFGIPDPSNFEIGASTRIPWVCLKIRYPTPCLNPHFSSPFLKEKTGKSQPSSTSDSVFGGISTLSPEEIDQRVTPRFNHK